MKKYPDEDIARKKKKYGCDGRCYWNTGMCPRVEDCPETAKGEMIANIMAILTLLALYAIIFGGIIFALGYLK